MKKFILLAIAALFVSTNVFATYRSAVITTSTGYKIGYEIGNVATVSNSLKKPGDYWYQPFAIKSPISNSTNYPLISDYASTVPFTIDSTMAAIAFNFVETINDLTVAKSPDLCNVTTADVEIVDAKTGIVLATPYVSTPFCTKSWIAGMATGNFNFPIPSTMLGMSVIVRMNVGWTGTTPAPYSTVETTDAFTLGYCALIGTAKLATESPLAMDISNSPNPANVYTTITLENVVNPVSLYVYDMLGREVANLTSALQSAGSSKSVMLNTTGLSNGMYLYRLATETGSVQKTLIVRH